MNFSGYLLVAAAAVLVVSAQQSGTESGNQRGTDTKNIIKQSSQKNIDASIYVNESIALREGYINGTNYVSISMDTIMNGISAAKSVVVANPELAKTILHQAFVDCESDILKAVRPYFNTYGEVMAYINDTTYEALEPSNRLQSGGLGLLFELTRAETLFDKGVGAGGNASLLLLDAVELAVETGYAACFSIIQESIRKADKVLRDHYYRTIQPPADNQNCDAAANDPQGAEAIKEIDEAASIAQNRSAHPDLVNEFREKMICIIGDLAKAAADGKQLTANSKSIAQIEPLAGKVAFFKQIEGIKKQFHSLVSKAFILISDAGLKSGTWSSEEIGKAIEAVEAGKIELFLSILSSEEFISFGIKYKGDAPLLGFDAAAKSGYYGKTALLQGLVKSAKLVFSVI